ncbi:3-dehydroquinate dehydratase [Aquiluna borgnonia]|jgi:3-dehydroquinate dehydratase-2|uniref:3-dehydroquinate dehydratase n=1 Tax=Aquiluna borgnonia TaxID=2499157 RepID=A0A7D4QBF7_9MICO|nr:type II 3-dehydroquinate dehydratase [Aquiluna borgnonia]QKJ25270.1 3-dehydroquinate dehydratase [Aquiluna borgnonia]
MRKIYVLNGPNLNMLGAREPEVYGHQTLADIEAAMRKAAGGVEIEFHQSASEDVLIGLIHKAFGEKADVILNPAAFTHYSYALRDACAMLASVGSRLIEVHISNPHSRESFRHNSVISGVATGVIAGFGVDSYLLALSQLTRN